MSRAYIDDDDRAYVLAVKKNLAGVFVRRGLSLDDVSDATGIPGVWGAMEPKTNVSSESHRKGAFRSPAHPPGITL